MGEPATFYTHLESPIGPLLLAGDEAALTLVSFAGGSKTRRPQPGWREDAAPFAEARRQLDAYFAGDLTEFDLPLRFTGTEFQKSVWRALLEIPFGLTTTYGALATRLGRPSASRAVGAANGANPLPIIAPCHRVIGANGALTGFGGGVERKRFLLALEGRADPDATTGQLDLFASDPM